MAFQAAVVHLIHPVRTMVWASTYHAAISLVMAVVVPWNTARGKAADAATNMMVTDGGVRRRKTVHWQAILDSRLRLPLLLKLQLLLVLSLTGNSAGNNVLWMLCDRLDEPALPPTLNAFVAVSEHVREPAFYLQLTGGHLMVTLLCVLRLQRLHSLSVKLVHVVL